MKKEDTPFDIYKARPTPENLRAAVNEHKSHIDNVVFRMLGKQVSPVVRTRADLIAADAIKKYDPSTGVPLKHWISQNLQSINRVARAATDIISIPEQLRRDSSQLMRSRNELREKLMRDPSDEELADHSGIAVRKQRRIAKGSLWNRAEGSYTADLEQGDGEGDEVMPGLAKDPMAEIHDYVYHDMDDIDKVIFQHRMGYRGAPVLPNQEIAKKLNMSSAAVTQRASRIQKRLEETSKWA